MSEKDGGDKVMSEKRTHPAQNAAMEILDRLQKRNHVLRDAKGNTAPVMELAEMFDIIHSAYSNEDVTPNYDTHLELIRELVEAATNYKRCIQKGVMGTDDVEKLNRALLKAEEAMK